MHVVNKTIQYNRGIRDAILNEINDRKYREDQEMNDRKYREDQERLRLEEERRRLEEERMAAE